MCASMAPLLQLPCAWLQGTGTSREDSWLVGCGKRTNGRIVCASLALLKSRQRGSVTECPLRAGMLKSVILCNKTFDTTGGAISALITPRKHEGHKYTLSEMLVQFVLLPPAQQRVMIVFVGRCPTTGHGLGCIKRVHWRVASHTVGHIH